MEIKIFPSFWHDISGIKCSWRIFINGIFFREFFSEDDVAQTLKKLKLELYGAEIAPDAQYIQSDLKRWKNGN